MNRKIVIFLLSVLLLGFSFYAYLGGFKSPEVKITTSETQYIAGSYYAGPPEEEQLGKFYKRASEYLEQKKLSGVLANIYYNNPEKQTDSIKAFIGIAIKDTTAQLPAGYSLRRLPGGRKVVQATIKAHYSLAPQKLYPALFEYLKKSKIKTKQTYLEIFATERAALVQTEIIP